MPFASASVKVATAPLKIAPSVAATDMPAALSAASATVARLLAVAELLASLIVTETE